MSSSSDLIKLPSSTVLGTKLFGGYVYNIDCQFGGTGGPSTMSLSIVSEDGTYAMPKITVDNLKAVSPTSIANNISFHGAVISYDLTKKAEQKILVVKYTDGSYILDQYFVGLHKRHGINREKKPGKLGEATGWEEKPKPVTDNLIIVGKEYHPCDTNFDSLVDMVEGGDQIDWCDPCPFCPPEKYKNTCIDNSERKIFATKYTFNEIIERMKEIKISLKNTDELLKDENIKKLPNIFTGSLRTVLQNWCSELGYSFYWDYKDNSLNFIDLKVPIKLDFTKYTENITDYTESKSIAETQSRGALSYYEREGSLEKYSCDDQKIITLTPFFYGDLRGKDMKKDGGLITTGSITSTIALPSNTDSKKTDEEFTKYLTSKEISIGLSYYSQAMREAYWFYNHYKITNWKKAWDQRVTDKAEADTSGRPKICFSYDALSLEEQEALNKKALEELGGMKILDVIAPGNSSDPWNVNAWSSFLSILPQEKKKEILEAQKKNAAGTGSVVSPEQALSQYYFLVVESSLELIAKQYEVESNLAENYMGKFWYRRYTPIVAGGADHAPSVEVHAPDADAKFYAGGAGFQGHPICSFGYEEGSYVDKLLKDVADNKKIDSYKAQFVVNPRASDGGKLVSQAQITKSYKVNSNMIIAQRDAKWYPNKTQLDDYKETFDYYRNEMGLFLLGNDGRPDLLTRLYPCAKEDKRIRVYCVRCVRSEEEMTDGLPISVSTIDNFIEVQDMKELRRTSRLADDKNEPYSDYKLIGKTGLNSRVTQWVQFDSFQFMMPVGGAMFQEETLNKTKQTLKQQMEEDTKKFQMVMHQSMADVAKEGDIHKEEETKWQSAAYRVLVSQSYEVPRYLDKKQIVYRTAVKKYGAKHDYFYHLLDDVANELKKGQCDPDLNIIQAAHNSISNYMIRENLEPKQTLNFTALGVLPISVEIEEGLDSFTITLGDNGPSTAYSLSSKYAEVPEGSLFDKLIQQLGHKLVKSSIGGQGTDTSYKGSYLSIH